MAAVQISAKPHNPDEQSFAETLKCCVPASDGNTGAK
jgi:hypothetical protein